MVVRPLLLALLPAVALGVSACGDDPIKPAPLTPAPTSASPSPTATSADPATPPPLPAAAKKQTVAGAKAFAEYYWEMVNYAQASGEVDPLVALASPTCEGCRGGTDGLRRFFDAGGKVVGGVYSTSNVSAKLVHAGSQPYWQVEMTLAHQKQFSDLPGTDKDDHSPASTHGEQMTLGWLNNKWHVDYLGADR